ncbi:PREDICTED: uncharacterized protein LOC104753113 isoform X1 [Camelina sativa]|uniref:Uncharacterized protein LOC104753113 isoform X1 n=1 Tax=Camelina sativa TaxID=90675 RepID=A0ABM0WNM0_CAMSA|nr:PREDICTED: uncharacterized protein LOC104753113 isoform X1 [Camelina sativa]
MLLLNLSNDQAPSHGFTRSVTSQSLVQPQIHGALVLELDWLLLRIDKNDPLVLCIAGADNTFRLVEVTVYVYTEVHCLLVKTLGIQKGYMQMNVGKARSMTCVSLDNLALSSLSSEARRLRSLSSCSLSSLQK